MTTEKQVQTLKAHLGELTDYWKSINTTIAQLGR